MRLQSSCPLYTVPYGAGGSASKTGHPFAMGLSVLLWTLSGCVGLPVGCLVSLGYGCWLLPQSKPEREPTTRTEALVSPQI